MGGHGGRAVTLPFRTMSEAMLHPIEGLQRKRTKNKGTHA